MLSRFSMALQVRRPNKLVDTQRQLDDVEFLSQEALELKMTALRSDRT